MQASDAKSFRVATGVGRTIAVNTILDSKRKRRSAWSSASAPPASRPGDILAMGTNHRGLSSFQDGDQEMLNAGRAPPR